jgi:hypothetical protein
MKTLKCAPIGWFSAVLAVAVLFNCKAATAQIAAPFQTIGYISNVDPVHNKLSCDSAGKTYIVNTQKAQIHLLAPLATPPETGDLVVGMRVQVAGALADGNVVSAQAVRVMPYIPPPAAPKNVPSVEVIPLAKEVNISGPISALDSSAKTIIVTSSGQTHVIHMLSQTAIADPSGHMLGLSSMADGDQVDIRGTAEADGSIDADNIVEHSSTSIASADAAEDVIYGEITQEPTFFKRDIRVRYNDSVIAVTVPKGISITIGERPVSVHELKAGMTVKMSGNFNSNHDFQASWITAGTPAQ